MARRRKYNYKKRPVQRRRNRRKVYGKNYRSGNYTSITMVPRTLVPDKMFATLEYSDRYVPSGVGGTSHVRVLRGSSCYDPDYSAVGHQPRGFDQIMAFYYNFRVHASRVVVKVVANTVTNAGNASEWTLVPHLDGTLYSGTDDPHELAEMPYSKHTIMSTNQGVAVLKQYMNTDKMFGYKTNGDRDLQGDTASNPTKNWHWSIIGQVIDETTTMQNIIVYYRIKYYVEFSNRRELDAS